MAICGAGLVRGGATLSQELGFKTRSARISSGNRYSSPAVPKLTNMSFRPRFSSVRTKVPSLGKRVPVFCDRIGLLVFSRSPGLMFISVLWLIMRCSADAYLKSNYCQYGPDLLPLGLMF